MTEGPADALGGRLVERGEDVVDVAGVELRMLVCDLVGPAPKRFVGHDPGALVRGQIAEVHTLRA
jgi:hypothetical protein